MEEEIKERPIFKNKHMINDIVAEWQREQLGRPLRILETCQEIGFGSERYREFGPVVAFEKRSDTFEKMRLRLSNSLKGNLLSLEECLDKWEEINGLYSDNFPVIIPSRPTDFMSTEGIHRLIHLGLEFDLIDVDPFGSCKPFFPDVLRLLGERSLLLVTTGDMQRIRHERYEKVMIDYNILGNQFSWSQTAFRVDCALYVGAWIIDKGLEKDMGLFPIFIHDYYIHPKGVQRIGFYVHKHLDPSARRYLKLGCVQRDPPLGRRIVCMGRIDLKVDDFSLKGDTSGSSTVRLFDRSEDRMRGEVKRVVQTAIIKRLEFLKNIGG